MGDDQDDEEGAITLDSTTRGQTTVGASPETRSDENPLSTGDESPTISVVIPTLNEEEELGSVSTR